MRILVFALVVAAGVVSGCATSTPIQRYSESQSNFGKAPEVMSHNYPAKDVYRLYQQASTGFSTIAGLREEVESRAEQFCNRQGRSMIVLGERISQPPYILGNFPRIEIVFAAVNKATH